MGTPRDGGANKGAATTAGRYPTRRGSEAGSVHPNETFDTADSHDEYERGENRGSGESSSSSSSSSRPQHPLHHHHRQAPSKRDRAEEGGDGIEQYDEYENDADDDDDNNKYADDSELPTRSPTTNRQSSSPLSGSTTIHSIEPSDDEDDAGGGAKRSERALGIFFLSDDAYDLCLQALYISAFGVFGSILRIYLGRFFGLDCQNAVSDDWFTRISDAICVTTNGKTDQTGGALFTDLPANMVGCLVMGLLSPSIMNQIVVHPIAWFRQDHPLQRHPAFAMALKVGFCGCLTTFASWNTQMVVMLDGTDTVLGSQVAPALVGYVVGMCTSIASFVCGRHVYDVWVRIHDPSALPQPDTADDGDVEIMEQGVGKDDRVCSKELVPNGGKSTPSPFVSRIGRLWGAVAGIRVMPFLLLAGMTSAFVVGDVVYDNMFYRKLWMCVVLSPCGALLRWRLSQYNANPPASVAATIAGWNLEWVPWGTLASNMIAVVISVLAEALEDRYAVRGEPGYDWISTVLPAIETGFAGSLSTVSGFVREIVDLQANPTRMYLYGFGSLTLAMLLGLLVYSPIIRYL